MIKSLLFFLRLLLPLTCIDQFARLQKLLAIHNLEELETALVILLEKFL